MSFRVGTRLKTALSLFALYQSIRSGNLGVQIVGITTVPTIYCS